MTEPRKCGGCGVPEIRTDRSVNLDPFTGYCVACLAQASKEARQVPIAEALDFDARAAAAGMEKDEE
jgi:hypothetical protein